jgi:hypothetical protein
MKVLNHREIGVYFLWDGHRRSYIGYSVNINGCNKKVNKVGIGPTC